MTTQDSTAKGFGRVWNSFAARFATLSRPALAWGGLALAAVILLSVNLISSIGLRNWQADLTQEQLFTISDGTREVLREIEEPIQVRLYFSKRLGEASPTYSRYFERVQRMLDSFSAMSGGKLEVSYFDPEPFSQEEDQAVAAGLRKVPINAEGEVGYFGLTGTNSTDDQRTIEFFYTNRETSLEYDVAKLVHTLANPKKPVIGVLTGLPLAGERDPRTGLPRPPWVIMQQIQDLFDLRVLEESVHAIPSDIDVLLVAQPTGLTPQAAYAIDQYMLGGGRALVLVDPVSEVTQFGDLGQSREGLDELAKVLRAWGIEFDKGAAAVDIAHARRVRIGPSGDAITDYVGWLALDQRNMEKSDVLSAGIEELNFASPGILKLADGAETTVAPIIRTSPEAMQVEITEVGVRADPIKLLQNYKPGGKPFVLMARISGEAQSAFPDGPPKDEKQKSDSDSKPEDEASEAEAKAAPHRKSGSINAVVIADTDLIADQFWVEQRDLLGQSVAVPIAQNAALVIGALENLSGSDELIALRGRGVVDRPFTLVADLRRNAERRFRESEQKLTQRLQELQQEIAKLESGSGSVLPTASETEAVNKFRSELLKTRQELRDVKLALRRDIDRLDGWLKFANIALVPLLIGVGGIGWTLWRARHAKRDENGKRAEDRT